MNTPKIIAIVGPTSSGKTALAVWLAKKLGGEIISADSRQVYKGLNIGTGKVTKKEMGGVKHHLLDVANPKKQFSADDFVRLGRQACANILQNNKIPIVVGGTGFYVDALLGRVVLPNVPPNPTLRAQLEKKTVKQLFLTLKRLDPARAKTIEPEHKRRLVRAIEIASYAKPTSADVNAVSCQGEREQKLAKPYKILWLGLNPSQERLTKNIHIRLSLRLRSGMIAEAKKLHTNGLSYKRMEELGLEYRSLAYLLQNKISLKEFETQLERAINHYAKRQLRWFKRNPDIRWIKNPPASRAGKKETLELSKKFLGGR